MMGRVLVAGVVFAIASCGSRAPSNSALDTLPATIARQRIPAIDRMNLEELSKWVRECGPYNGSPEGRAKNPYDPMDCDEVQFRHDSWHQPRTQKPGGSLPAVH
jgi:hypothetical protein